MILSMEIWVYFCVVDKLGVAEELLNAPEVGSSTQHMCCK